jgi:hypothetical protein
MTIRPAAKVRNRQTTFYVTGDSGTEYIVHNKRNAVTHRKVWTCNCPDFTERRQFNNTHCKHIVEVQRDLMAKAADAIIAAHIQIPAGATYSNGVDSQPSLPTVRQTLDTVVRVLNGPNGRQLWHILTALRGPDNGSISLKSTTTAEIRGAIGIKGFFTGAVCTNYGAFGKDIQGEPVNIRDTIFQKLRDQYDVESHFAYHYAEALIALKQLGYIK